MDGAPSRNARMGKATGFPLAPGVLAMAMFVAVIGISITIFVCFHWRIPNPSLEDALFVAQDVGVNYVAGGSSHSMTWISRKRNAQMLELLHSSRQIHADAESGDYDVLLTVYADRIPMHNSPTLRYSTTTGRVWFGGECAYVPEEFRNWLRNEYDNTPKQRYRTHSVGPITFDEPVPPPHQPPVPQLQSQPARWHLYSVLDAKSHMDMHSVLGPSGTVAFEAQYWVGSNQAIKHMEVRPTAPCWQWPPSYVGKIITYQFRWKYRDGTYGPWSKVVSAKVLP